MEKENPSSETAPPVADKLEGDETTVKNIDEEDAAKEIQGLTISEDPQTLDNNAELDGKLNDKKAMETRSDEENLDMKVGNDESNKTMETKDLSIAGSIEKQDNNVEHIDKMHSNKDSDSKAELGKTETNEEVIVDEEAEPVFDGTEIPDVEVTENVSGQSSDFVHEAGGSAWPDKAVALKNFVKEKSSFAVTTFMRRLSGKGDQIGQDISAGGTVAEASPKTEKFAWNPLNYIKVSRDVSAENSAVGENISREAIFPIVTKGNVILYSRLGCPDCREIRSFLREKRLRFVEINIDLYPSRESEVEKFSGSSAVPKVFFNEILIGGLEELKGLDKSGKLKDKIEYLISESPSLEAPMCPLSAEDDESNDGPVDEFALIVNKMKGSIVVKDRFYKMRRFTNCFLGSEAVNFLSEDQYLEREEAIEFGRKLASKLFFRHVLDENLFEDGNQLYRFLDHDPIVSAHCHNIPKGITELKPKPIKDIVSRLRLLCSVVFEIYTAEDGKHVDYRSIHGSEEFARYLRLVQELQRVELEGLTLTRDEKLAFFINLYNLMAIHGILECGPPTGPLDRRKLFGDFKYLIGGCTYSLSAIQNGILRANRRPPYNLMKPFAARDKRSSVALIDAEPLIHFALVSGARSGPALRSYSAENIDKELIEAAQQFFRDGGLLVDSTAKVAYVSKILKWFSIDFGKNEVDVLKHAATYLDPTQSEELLELLTSNDLKVIYQPYDWGLNW